MNKVDKTSILLAVYRLMLLQFKVRLYEDGFKDRYYESKFGVLPQQEEFRYRVAAEYTLGLCWVLRYYYQVTLMKKIKVH